MGVGCVDRWRANYASIADEFQPTLLLYEVHLQDCDFLFSYYPVFADYALDGVVRNAQFSGDYVLPDCLPELKRWESRMKQFSRAQL